MITTNLHLTKKFLLAFLLFTTSVYLHAQCGDVTGSFTVESVGAGANSCSDATYCQFSVTIIASNKTTSGNSSAEFQLFADTGNGNLDPVAGGPVDKNDCEFTEIVDSKMTTEVLCLPCATQFYMNWQNLTARNCNGNDCNSNRDPGTGDFVPEPVAIALPVELVKFTSRVERSNIVLEWVTASEENNDYFAIEHSKNGREFKEIGRVNGNGTIEQMLHYQYVDKSPLKGKNYYQLKQVDFDGTATYSEIRVSEFDTEDANIKVIPSHALNKLSLVFYDNFVKEAPVEVFNMVGQQMASQLVPEGNNEITFNISDWKSGQYIIRIRGEEEFILKRFIKIE